MDPSMPSLFEQKVEVSNCTAKPSRVLWNVTEAKRSQTRVVEVSTTAVETWEVKLPLLAPMMVLDALLMMDTVDGDGPLGSLVATLEVTNTTSMLGPVSVTLAREKWSEQLQLFMIPLPRLVKDPTKPLVDTPLKSSSSIVVLPSIPL
jgi:hypothetical protein